MNGTSADQITSIVNLMDRLSPEDQDRIRTLVMLLGAAPPFARAQAEEMIWKALRKLHGSRSACVGQVDATIDYLEQSVVGRVPGHRTYN